MANDFGGPGQTGDSFLQPGTRSEIEIKVKGSRFLAEVSRALDVGEAQAILAAIRKRHHDATHHCSAWRIGPDGREFRSDDDGEPSGSAGLPILRQVDARGLTNTIVVVTRWFGGTKLGTGGLVRAYGDAAREALAVVLVDEKIVRTGLELEFAFEDTSPAMHTIAKFDALMVETRYGIGTSIVVAVRRSQVGAFETAWVEALRGRGSITPRAVG